MSKKYYIETNGCKCLFVEMLTRKKNINLKKHLVKITISHLLCYGITMTIYHHPSRTHIHTQVSVRVLGEEKEEKGGGGNWLRWIRTVCTCEPSDLLGLQVAIGVLASLLGLGLIAASVSGVLLYRR